jgi:hypothetical protein
MLTIAGTVVGHSSARARNSVNLAACPPVGHADQQDVVESINSINLGQQLVDNGVVGACAVTHAATLPADGIDLIKDNDVQLLWVSQSRNQDRSHEHVCLNGCQVEGLHSRGCLTESVVAGGQHIQIAWVEQIVRVC